MQKRFLCILFISIAFSCSFTSVKLQKYPNTQLIKTARARYGTNYQISYNFTKTYALCVAPLAGREKKLSKDKQVSSFFIFDLQKGRTLYSESPGRATVRWRGDTQIEIRSIPGIIKGGEKMNDIRSAYIFDIVSAQKKKAPVFDNRD